MSPQVVAAIIAASVSFLTLIGTLAAQYFGRRATSRDTERALEEQGKHLDRTLAEQREQLDRTLAEQRTRTLNERFATAAEQLGSDKPAAVRLAGVYAMAGLADDWEENRQTCVDVLCAYLRMPYAPDPGDEAPEPMRLGFRADREVRHTVIRVIAAHLRAGARESWQSLNFDFTGVVIDGGDFSRTVFSGGRVSFEHAVFSGDEVTFEGATFSGGQVDFSFAEFSGGVNFSVARFSADQVSFSCAQFSGEVGFAGAEFSRGQIWFMAAEFSAGKVYLSAEFSGGQISFLGTRFAGSQVDFGHAVFSAGQVDFGHAEFRGGEVSFMHAEFSGGAVGFDYAEFSGGTVSFLDGEFSGGIVDFSDASDWSCPPAFPWTDTPPLGVKLPKKEDQSQA
jgi:uncharacterized protein YjbI with pentapeptide repeats